MQNAKVVFRTIICPVCKGKRKIKVPYQSRQGLGTASKRAIAKILRKNNYSLREIGKLINISSASAVKFLLETDSKEKGLKL